MVLGIQVVPAHPRTASITRNSGLQAGFQTDHVRYRALHLAVQPSLTRHSCGRHPLRSSTRCRPTRRARDVLHYLWWHRRVHANRRDVPLRDARRPRGPAAAHHALAPTLRAPLDGYLDHRLLELPLAPVLPEHLHCAWRAPRRCALREARSVIRRIRRVRPDALCWVVGSWEGDGVQQRKFLPFDGHRRDVRARLVACDWQAGAWFLGLGVDDDVDHLLGNVYDGWVGTTRHVRM